MDQENTAPSQAIDQYWSAHFVVRYLCQRCVAVQIGRIQLHTHYLSDGLCTLITRTFDDLEVGRVGLGRTQKLVKPSDLVDFCKGELFPRVVFPAKEPCMQTTILKRHTSSSSVAESLGLSNCPCCPWTIR